MGYYYNLDSVWVYRAMIFFVFFVLFSFGFAAGRWSAPYSIKADFQVTKNKKERKVDY